MSLLKTISLILHRPRFLALLLIIPLLAGLFYRWSTPLHSAPFIKYKSATSGGSWEALSEFKDDQFDSSASTWRGAGGWLGWPNAGKRNTLLITGGAGQLGQSLIPLLETEYIVHVLDIAPRPSSLPKSIKYHRGSILPTSKSLTTLFASTSFDGVIHLAGIGLDAWCEPKEAHCLEVNEGGTKALLDQVERTITKKRGGLLRADGKTPWVVLASSMEVFGEDAFDEESIRRPTTALGRTILKAEHALEHATDRFTTQAGSVEASLHGMVLRLPDVYGYPSASAVPFAFPSSILTNALTSLPIQYSSDAAPRDLVHIKDITDGFLKAIARMEDRVQVGTSTTLESINLVSGKRWSEEEVVQLVRVQTQSMSPVRDIGQHRSTSSPAFSTERAKLLLDWAAKIALPVGVGLSVATLSEEIADYSKEYLVDHCAPTPEFPSPDGSLVTTFIEDERNKDLNKLDGCTVNMAFDHAGWLHHVKCEDGKHCTADGDKVTAMNWNQSVFIVRQVESSTPSLRIARVMFEEEKGMGYLGFRSSQSGIDEQVGLELFKEPEQGVQIEFDIEVQHDASNLRLLVPDTSDQLHAVTNATDDSTWFTLEPSNRWVTSHFDMRMNVLCCPSEGDWPLLLDDYESADMRFGSTGQIPFNSSRRSHLCHRAEQAVRYNHARLTTARQIVDKISSGGQPSQLSAGSSITRHKPHDWALKELPVCWNDCDSPTICVQTGDCKCVQADHCHPRRENPLISLFPASPAGDAGAGKSHLGALAGYTPVLTNAVGKIDWMDMLLPAARQALRANPSFIKVHVADGYDGQEAIESADCHKLQTTHCFSADSIMYKALRHISVPAEEAELVVLPVYQHCTGAEFLLHDVMHHAAETIPGVKSGEQTVALVLTHDWGVCISFAWEIWSARDKHTLYPDWILNNMLVWSVMGDYDSPCYRPQQDVVIPARTCRSYTLRDTFPDVEHIKPMRERPNLLTWSGTYWGTGKSERLRLTCERGGAGARELIKGKGAQSNFESWDYMNDLSNARFCPQPRGIAGWSPRTNDAIFAGCIPVLIAEGSHYPFATMLDWSKFSVRVAPTELDRIEEILAAIPLSKVEEMQANLVSVREAFLYSTDEKPEEELERKGPMFFALHEARMRVRTRYPIKPDI